ncbi:MAG: hypothetical protein AAF327_00025 [Cyanobacteria bacterium P01_A01_bin.37]
MHKLYGFVAEEDVVERREEKLLHASRRIEILYPGCEITHPSGVSDYSFVIEEHHCSNV